jgi:hypothetical protein
MTDRVAECLDADIILPASLVKPEYQGPCRAKGRRYIQNGTRPQFAQISKWGYNQSIYFEGILPRTKLIASRKTALSIFS